MTTVTTFQGDTQLPLAALLSLFVNHSESFKTAVFAWQINTPSNQQAMASNLLAMASNLLANKKPSQPFAAKEKTIWTQKHKYNPEVARCWFVRVFDGVQKVSSSGTCCKVG